MHPILFRLFGLEIRTYGVMVAAAFFVGIYGASLFAEKQGIKKYYIYDLGLLTVVFGLLGARLLYVAIWWKDYVNNPLEILMVWKGGLVYYGGFILATIAALTWMNIKKLPVLKISDILVPFLALAHSIARIGCFFNGCCYGREDVHGIIFRSIGDNLPHLPTQLYESAANFVNFIILILFNLNSKKKKGDVLYLYLLNYGVIRTIMEVFRGDPERGTIFMFSTSTFISMFLIAAGIIGLIYNKVKKESNEV